MENTPTILLLGNSLLLDSVAECLEKELANIIVRFEDTLAVCQADFGSCLPDMIVFEQESLPADVLVRLLHDYPGIQWLGLDPNCSQISVYNSRRHTTRTMKDLFRVFQDVLSGAEVKKGGKWTKQTEKESGIQE